MSTSADRPAISVLVPVYNGMPYLPETIDALLAQTFGDFELLIANDGSKDDTADYLAQLTDPRIRVITQANQGLCASMNRLLSEAKGPVAARIDQDDIALPQRLERQLAALEREGYDFLFAMIEKVGDERAWSNRDQEKEVPGKVTPLKGLEHGGKVHSTLLGRTAAWREIGYRAAYFPCDDWDFQLRAEERYRVGLLHERLVQYRFHGSSNTHGRFKIMQDRTRWAEACAFARRAGADEPSETAFDQAQHAQPRWRRVNRARKDAYRWAQRAGGEAWLNGRTGRAAMLMLAAALLGPERLGKRIWRLARPAG